MTGNTLRSFAWGVSSLCRYISGQRMAEDVLCDLKYENVSPSVHAGEGKNRGWWLAGVAGFCLLTGIITARQSFIVVSPHALSCLCVIILSVYVLGARVYQRRLVHHHRWQIDYYLPMVMERLVMAVEAGLDLIPAFHAVVEIEEQESDHTDPITALLAEVCRYVDSGIGFPEALALVESRASGSALKHAFVHLALAYQEGGEIIYPLRELSDASQIQFQETLEEEIAKMPVRATLPLLCTFAGLIISFLTAPLIQVLAITQQAHPG